jgi:hypothetical protein
MNKRISIDDIWSLPWADELSWSRFAPMFFLI